MLPAIVAALRLGERLLTSRAARGCLGRMQPPSPPNYAEHNAAPFYKLKLTSRVLEQTTQSRSVAVELDLEPEQPENPHHGHYRVSVGSTRFNGDPWTPPVLEIEPPYGIGPKRWPALREAISLAFEDYARRFPA